jgi:hypothetical protein
MRRVRARKVQRQRLAAGAGFDWQQTKTSIRGVAPYLRNRREFRRQASVSGNDFEWAMSYPCLTDRFDAGGVAAGQYFHQDLYVAQQIQAAQPERHVDVGSRVDGLVAHVAAFREVEVFDIRPIRSSARNISFVQRDITVADPSYDAHCDSLSCLHALEHFGLGRYGDTVDYLGYMKGWANLKRLVRPGGTFYFSVPISRRQRIEYDAHRVFSLPFLLEEVVADGFRLEAFAYIDDLGDLHTGVDTTSEAASRTFDLNYGCGVFTLTRAGPVG